jgi:hypothetical protein
MAFVPAGKIFLITQVHTLPYTSESVDVEFHKET